MSEWIALNAESLNKGEATQENGVTVTVFISPFDVPEGVRGTLDAQRNVFVIEFRYLSDMVRPSESLKRTCVEEGLFIYDSYHSHRIYKIELDLNVRPVTDVQLCVNIVGDAIANFGRTHKRPKNRGRYEVNREVITSRGRDIFKGLVGSH